MDRRKELVLELADLEDDEEVKQIEHPYDDYFVTSYGRVFSTKHYAGKRVSKRSLRANPGGYLYLNLSSPENGIKTFYVHQLVAEYFIGPCPKNQQVRHLNGKQSDNRLDNITYGTLEENAADKEQHGTVYRPLGEKHGASKLTEPEVIEIRKIYSRGGVTQQYLADEHGVSRSLISMIVNRKRWPHL